MAQRINVVLLDDVDGSEAAETVYFSLDGNHYEIDLSAGNADRLRADLKEFTSVARQTTCGDGSVVGALPSEIRKWARDTGRDVPARGRVSADLRAAFHAAR